MNRKSIVVALVVSLVVSMVLWSKLQTTQQPSGGPPTLPPVAIEPAKKDVVVAKRRVPARTRLEEATINDFFVLESRIASAVPDNAFTNIASLSLKYTGVTLLASDVMTTDRLMDKDSIINLSFAVPEGKRAISLGVTPMMGVSGFVQQGDFVDVIATFRPPNGETINKIVMQDIQVLAVGKTYYPEMDAQSSATMAIMGQVSDLITLAVSPDEVERLGYLESSGVQFKFLLKNPKDKNKKVTTSGATEKIVMKDTGVSELIKPAETVAAAHTSPELVTPTPVFNEPVVPTKPLVEPDEGKVEVVYGLTGGKRKEEMIKDGYDLGDGQSPGGKGSFLNDRAGMPKDRPGMPKLSNVPAKNSSEHE